MRMPVPAAVGSSPRLRGTRHPLPRQRPDVRFIPAPAGNTIGLPRRSTRMPVHPRACGEHGSQLFLCLCICGSSPRLRGTPAIQQEGAGQLRFIPAPAGNTSHWPSCRWLSTVHPRACGEHSSLMAVPCHQVGSSARLRGTRMRSLMTLTSARFIPAPAGNTLMRVFLSKLPPVHPRACGEHVRLAGHAATGHGSSPRLRGTHRVRQITHHRQRFIPAPAGNTSPPWRPSTLRTVHPRACGEHPHPVSLSCGSFGSSPRLRGTPSSRMIRGVSVRFIPAPAGNTTR